MAETQDENTASPARRARTRRRPTAVTAAPITPAPAADAAPVGNVAAARELVSAFTALASAAADGQAKGHPLSLRRSGEGKFVASCSRCGLELPVLDTARNGWTYPSPGACPNPLRPES